MYGVVYKMNIRTRNIVYNILDLINTHKLDSEYNVLKDLEDMIIDLYESDNGKYNGITSSGYNPKKKETLDLVIPNQCPRWERIYTFLNAELARNVKIYLDQLNKIDNLNIYI